MRFSGLLLFTAVCWFFPVSQIFGEIVTQTVSLRHGDAVMEGYIAYDGNLEGKRPGIIVFHEWWGLNDYVRRRVEKLAGMGYAAMAADMYGRDKVTGHPKEARQWMQQVTGDIHRWRERAQAWLTQLKAHRLIDGGRVAAIGYCFGGSTVQQLAYSRADLKGVVSFHGSLIAPPAKISGGVPARMLVLHGAADPMVKMEDIPDYIAAMERSGIDWQLIVYGGARHGFTNPEADRRGMEALGYSPSADRRSWEHMKLFLDELFGR